MATKNPARNPANNLSGPGEGQRKDGAHKVALPVDDDDQPSVRRQETKPKKLNRDPIARACIHASPRAWLAWLTPLPDDAGTPERLDTQGTFINRIPDVLYRVPTPDREWIICVEAQSKNNLDLGSRFRLAMVSYFMDVPTVDPFPLFVPVELRMKHRSRTKVGRFPCVWGPDEHHFTWICSNDLLQNVRRLERLERTLGTVTIHAWHNSTTLEGIVELGKWTGSQPDDQSDKWHVLVLLGLISRVRFGVHLRWMTPDEEYLTMNALKRQGRMDSELMEHLKQELEERMLEREARGEARGIEAGRAEGREEERATLVSLAHQLLPDRFEALKEITDLDELRRVVASAVADVAKRVDTKTNGSV